MTATLHQIGKPRHEAESAAIKLLQRLLPDSYSLFSNVFLATGNRPGETYEHDVIAIAPFAVFTIELKAYSGRITGNRDQWQLDDGRWIASPIPLTEEKARVLKGLLATGGRDLRGVWVQGVVFLSLPDARIEISESYSAFVHTRATIVRALTDPAFFRIRGDLVQGQRARIASIISDNASSPPYVKSIGAYDLLERLPTPEMPYSAYTARDRLLGATALLHIYDLGHDNAQRRDRIRARALCEATLHTKLRHTPDILKLQGHFPVDDPPRIVLAFEDTTPFVTMATWVRMFPRAAMSVRLTLGARIARTIHAIHKAGVVHRCLSPDVILIEPVEDPRELRVCAFELGKDLTTSATTIGASALQNRALRCIAPEVLMRAETTPRADQFSLGAILYELFTGRQLFSHAEQVLAPVHVTMQATDGQPLPGSFQDLVNTLLARDPLQRLRDAEAAAEALDMIARPSEDRGQLTGEFVSGMTLRGNYQLLSLLGRGATGPTWKARHLQTDELLAIKIGSPERAEVLDNEVAVLRSVDHDNIVRFVNLEALPDGRMLLITRYVAGVSGREHAGAGDPLTLAQLRTIASGLYGAIQALHNAGWLHRDIKPENLVLKGAELTPVLLDPGIACRIGQAGELLVGSIAYKDPALWTVKEWSPAQDLYAAALVLYELLTGVHPFHGAAPDTIIAPLLSGDHLPDSFSAEVRRQIIAFFRTALAPDPAHRYSTAKAVLSALNAALSKARPLPLPALDELTALPVDIDPDAPLEVVTLSVRAKYAAARLGIVRMSDLSGLTAERLKQLPNVGRKTAQELLGWTARIQERWPDLAPLAEFDPGPALCSSLINDPRPLSDLGPALAPAIKEQLTEQGINTIGQLAALPLAAVLGLPSVGEGKFAKLREALAQLLDRRDRPGNLEDLRACFEDYLKPGQMAALDNLLGLTGGATRTLSVAGEQLGLTRQRMDQLGAAAVEALRAAASPGVWLTEMVRELAADIGFVSLARLAQALAHRFPAQGGDGQHRGYALLAAVLIEPDRRPTRLDNIIAAALPPWTMDGVGKVAAGLRALCPEGQPAARDEAASAVWELAGPAVQQALDSRGIDRLRLLQAALTLAPELRQSPGGSVFLPPLPLAQAARELRADLELGLPLRTFLSAVQNRAPGTGIPNAHKDIILELKAAGLALINGRVADPRCQELAEPADTPVLDKAIERQRVRPAVDTRPPVARELAVQARSGGFRVIALEPARHHLLSLSLARWLQADLGEDQARYIDVDRLLIQTLKDEGLWQDALFYEDRADATWGWAEPYLIRALNAQIAASAPGTVTILARPALLVTLGLVRWISGLYDRARGGRHGLIVFAMPGGVRDGRIWLNNTCPIPWAPDMAPVYLETLESE